MTAFQTIVSFPKRSSEHCLRTMIASAFALTTTLLPASALGMDVFPKSHTVKAPLLLPPVLDSTRWMDWKPSPPLFKTDTLLAPGGGLEKNPAFRFEYERSLPRMS
jgi:hypothetical protein